MPTCVLQMPPRCPLTCLVYCHELPVHILTYTCRLQWARRSSSLPWILRGLFPWTSSCSSSSWRWVPGPRVSRPWKCLVAGCKMELDLPARSYEPGSGHAEEHSLTMGYMVWAPHAMKQAALCPVTMLYSKDVSLCPATALCCLPVLVPGPHLLASVMA